MSKEAAGIHEATPAETTNESTSRLSRVITWCGETAAATALAVSSFGAGGEAVPAAHAQPEGSTSDQNNVEDTDNGNQNNEQAKALQNDELNIEKSEFAVGCREDNTPTLTQTLQTNKDANYAVLKVESGEDDQAIGLGGGIGGGGTVSTTTAWENTNLSQTQSEEVYHTVSTSGETDRSEPETVEYPDCGGSGGSDETSPDGGDEDTTGDNTNEDNIGGSGEYPVNVEVVEGATPAETAALLSGREFLPEDVDQLVLATDEDYADAMAGGPLAYHVGGPLLFSDSEQLSGATTNEIERLAPREVLMLGGTQALSEEVEQQLRNLGVNVYRIAGPTRFETAVEVDQYMHQHTNASIDERYAVNAFKFADAVAASELAAQEGASIVLSQAGNLHPTTRKNLENNQSAIDQVTAIGGLKVIRSEVLRASGNAADASTERLAGDNRFQTSSRINAEDYTVNGNSTDEGDTSMYVTSGSNFHDPLATAPIAARDKNGATSIVPRELTAETDSAYSSWEGTVETYKHSTWDEAVIVGLGSSATTFVDQKLDATAPVDQ